MLYNNTFTAPASIYRPSYLNPGGWCSLLFFLHEDVEAWPVINPATDIIVTELILKSGKSFYTIKGVENDRLFNETSRRSNSGISHEVSATCKIGGNDNNITLTLGRLQHHQFGLLVKDRNGERRLIGDADSGAVIEFNYTSGDWNDQRGRQVRWVWNSTQPVPIYDYVIPTSGVAIITEDGLEILTEDGQSIITE